MSVYTSTLSIAPPSPTYIPALPIHIPSNEEVKKGVNKQHHVDIAHVKVIVHREWRIGIAPREAFLPGLQSRQDGDPQTQAGVGEETGGDLCTPGRVNRNQMLCQYTYRFNWFATTCINTETKLHRTLTYETRLTVQRLSVAVQRGNAASVLGSTRSRDAQDFSEGT